MIECSETVRLHSNIEDIMSNFKNGSMSTMEKGKKLKRNRSGNSSFPKAIKVKILICWLLRLSFGLVNVKRKNSTLRDLPLTVKKGDLTNLSVPKSCRTFSREAGLTWK